MPRVTSTWPSPPMQSDNPRETTCGFAGSTIRRASSKTAGCARRLRMQRREGRTRKEGEGGAGALGFLLRSEAGLVFLEIYIPCECGHGLAHGCSVDGGRWSEREEPLEQEAPRETCRKKRRRKTTKPCARWLLVVGASFLDLRSTVATGRLLFYRAGRDFIQGYGKD